jgi:uncharacterized 2Fe-2S/4Fe-4S cluster protein (DUF4445 family)
MNSPLPISPSDLDPIARKYLLTLPAPSLTDTSGDIDRIVSALKGVLPAGKTTAEIGVPLDLMRRASSIMREAAYDVTAVVAQKSESLELIDLIAGHDPVDCYGVAVDVGTTTVRLYLVNMTNGEIAGNVAVDNPQAVHGEDILSRIHFAQQRRGLQTLQDLIVSCINEAITILAEKQRLRPSDIYAMSIAGNPTMTHLLLGLSPYHLCREPYVPVINQPLQIKAEELMIDTHPEAPVYVFPNTGSYFGGDVVAGILAAGLHWASGASLLVDVGTNAEIVLGNRDWLVACAGAAGPALESGGAKAGMPAREGAIERVSIDRQTLEPKLKVIGGGPAKGICGSGLIDLVAELFLSGVIDPRGRISDGKQTRRIRASGDVKAYVVALAEEREAPQDILVDELDIGNLVRAKGAMYTALTLITERLGVRFKDLDTFFVAGSFGEHINPKNAIAIGMLPDIPLERFRVIGNSAGLGACMMLASYKLRKEVEYIRSKSVYLQLNVENEFMNRLNAALFIPHTDRELFPRIRPPTSF